MFFNDKKIVHHVLGLMNEFSAFQHKVILNNNKPGGLELLEKR
ncbi:hypothetical protein [Legionella worsleiensis]|nr:hypothetical protein [Legionella worsleiensis]